MNYQVLYFVLAGVMLVLIPIIPTMMHLRVRILRALHLKALAAWYERHFEGLTLAVRIIIAIIALIMLALGFGLLD